MLFDVGRGAAGAGAKVDEDVVADRGAEVLGEDARGELRGGGALEDGDLGRVNRGDPGRKGGTDMGCPRCGEGSLDTGAEEAWKPGRVSSGLTELVILGCF